MQRTGCHIRTNLGAFLSAAYQVEANSRCVSSIRTALGARLDQYRERGITSEGASERSCPPRTKLRPPLVVFPLSRYLSESDRVLVGIRWFGCHHCYCTPCHPSGAMPCAAGSSRKSNQSDLTSPISEIKYKIPDLRSFRFSIFEIFDF